MDPGPARAGADASGDRQPRLSMGGFAMSVKDVSAESSETLPVAVRLAADAPRVRVGDKGIGAGAPVFVIGEIGINHNGSVEIAKRLIDGAVLAGADAVKLQKRTPEKCVPRDQWNIERDTPWGRMTYIEYRRRMEFGPREYAEIDRYCAERGMLWFASCWDEESVD